jgi:hypothetical protein
MNVRLPAPLAYFDQSNEAETRRAIEQALASLGTQGISFFSELEAGSLDVTGAASVGTDLAVTGDITAATLVVGTDPGGALEVRVGGRVYADEGVRAGVLTRPAEINMTRVNIDTAVWTSVLPTGTDFVTALVQIRDATNGGSALVYADVNNATPVLVAAQPASTTIAITGAPTATQIGVRISGTDLEVLAGSSRDNAQVDTTILFSVL